MLSKVLLVFATAALLSLGCSSAPPKASGNGGAGGTARPDGASDGGDPLIVPQGLSVSLEQGGAGTLSLYALTLRDGPDGVDLYAALTNNGNDLACDAALKVTLYDKAGQPLGNYINGLYTSQFYLYALSDASTTIAACVSPGHVAMTKVSTMTPSLTVADVGSIVYYYAYFALTATPLAGLTVGPVSTVTTDGGGTAYAGTVTNHLDQAVSGPSVAIFSLSPSGRPLALTTVSDSSQVPSGSTWSFQTSAIDTPGTGYAAFPSASF
jgi:hypothetical protein